MSSDNGTEPTEEQGPETVPKEAAINWIASYPKSGNTWVRMLLGHYTDGMEDPYFDVKMGDLHKFWYQAASSIPVSEFTGGQQVMFRGAAMANLWCFVNRPTLCKTHHANIRVNEIPLFTQMWTGHVIYVVRDPRDVVASFQDHMGLDSRDEAIHFMGRKEATIQGDYGLRHVLTSWNHHVHSWTLGNEVREPLVVRYEDMHEDTHREVRRMIKYLGFEPDEERVDHAVEMCRFDRLQKREEREGFPEKSDQHDRFFRKGQTGGHTEELTDEQIERVEQEHGEMMIEMGYEPKLAPVGA